MSIDSGRERDEPLHEDINYGETGNMNGSNDTSEDIDDTASIQVQQGDFPVPIRSYGNPATTLAALTIDEVKVTALRSSGESPRPRKSSDSGGAQA